MTKQRHSQMPYFNCHQRGTSHWGWTILLMVALSTWAPMYANSFSVSNQFRMLGQGKRSPASQIICFNQLEETSSLSSSSPSLATSQTLTQTASSKTATTMPARKARHKGRRAKTKDSSISSMGSYLSNDEVCQHVNAQYLHGPGGALRSTTSKRNPEIHDHESLENLDQLKRLDQNPALVLNADYLPISFLPLSLWNWQEAVKAVFSGKVTVVEVYPDVTIRAVNLEIPLPSVIALNEYAPQPNSKPAFTKRNVFLRDEYRCQYCSHQFHSRDLSLDHVMPRCMGGRLVWENAVTCCKKCNGRKGCLTVDQIKHVGMKLRREPFIPSQYQLHKIAGQLLPKRVHPSWAPYLGITSTTTTTSTSDGTYNLAEEMLWEDIP